MCCSRGPASALHILQRASLSVTESETLSTMAMTDWLNPRKVPGEAIPHSTSLMRILKNLQWYDKNEIDDKILHGKLALKHEK